MASAAKDTGLQHVIWSTLEDTRQWVPLSDSRMPTLMGKYKVPHFDAKGEANGLFTAAGVPTTFLLTSFINFIHFGIGPKKVRMAGSPSHFRCKKPRSPPKTSANARTGSSRRAASWSERPSASPASTSLVRRSLPR
jgi:hypothetical protein